MLLIMPENVDNIRKRRFIDNSQEIEYTFEELLQRSKGIFRKLLYIHFPTWRFLEEDLWQECAMYAFSAFHAGNYIKPEKPFACLKGLYKDVIFMNIKRERRSSPFVSIDSHIHEDDENSESLSYYLGVNDIYSVIDYSLFTDDELLLLLSIQAGYDYNMKSKEYLSMAAKLSAYIGEPLRRYHYKQANIDKFTSSKEKQKQRKREESARRRQSPEYCERMRKEQKARYYSDINKSRADERKRRRLYAQGFYVETQISAPV